MLLTSIWFLPPFVEFRRFPPTHFQCLPDSWFLVFFFSDSIYGSTYVHFTESQSLITCLKQTVRNRLQETMRSSLLSPHKTKQKTNLPFGIVCKSLLGLAIIIYTKIFYIHTIKREKKPEKCILLKSKEE